MNRVLIELKNKKVISLICCTPLLAILGQILWVPLTAYKFWSNSLAISAYAAVSLLVLTLSLAPLSKHFPTVRLFSILNRREYSLS